MHPLTSGDPAHIGPHRLLARLGAGGMGEVYLARSPQGRLAALKVVKEDLARDQEFRSRFAREVRTAQMVEGPFTPDVVDADPHADLPWMATEYVPGPTLKEAVRENGPFPEASLRVLTIGLARALQAIHAAGLMHRDLKPDNVLLSPRGPQVIDFGIARAVEGTVLTKTGQAFGTPSYTSPEQVMGQETSPASDVFSLSGVVVYAATGRPPFGSGKAAEVLPRVVSQDPNLDGVPESLRPFLARCLAKDPTERPTSDEIVRGLSAEPLPSAEHGWLPAQVNQSINAHQHEAHQVIQASPSGPLQNTTAPLNQPPGGSGKGKRRTGLIAAGAGAAVLVLAAGIGLAAVAPWENGEGGEGTAAPGSDSDEPNEAAGEADPETLGDQDDMAEPGDTAAGIEGAVYDLQFTPDGSGLYVHTATASTFWDWENGEMLERLSPYPGSIALSASGNIVTTYTDTAAVLNADREPLAIFEHAEENPQDILFHDTPSISPDGSLVALTIASQDETSRLYLWDWEEDTIVHTAELPEMPSSTRFSHDGSHLAVSYRDQYPRTVVHETQTWDEVVGMPEEGPDEEFDFQVYRYAFSPTEPLIAVSVLDNGIVLYDLEENEVVQEIQSPTSIYDLAFSPDGNTLYSGGSPTSTQSESGGRAWDLTTGEELTSGTTLLNNGIAVHPGGELLLTADDQDLLFLDTETFDIVHEIS
ncbi:WD40 repeat domain-containing serine/threonine protein kinase [Nocardiopsis metallicus]|uniref:DNA-binding beta-propeller fold protein YncE n=1 Tax=Nocardiopsis metallicus TaxID=179819 RepID=A0A840W945_9ACTN|nr:serine/threonine-protein kinase [Nocardiopsis metallicus]MBB5493580.1 DNA-binding beta-propeller fold protein YncE [Nocardiopsis metallicus]